MKVVLIVLGAVASAIALGLLVGGFVILGLVGSDGFVDSGTHPIKTSTRVLVSQTARITHEAQSIGRLGDFSIRLQAAPRGSKPVFIGVGRTADVNAYLAKVDRDVVRNVDFDPFVLVTVHRPGDAVPAPPTDQSFWAAKASGDGTIKLDWKVRGGNWRVVIMNADGAPGVRIDGLLGVKVPFARPLAFILLGSAVLALILGVVLIVIGIRIKPKPKEPPAFAAADGDVPPVGSAPPPA